MHKISFAQHMMYMPSHPVLYGMESSKMLKISTTAVIINHMSVCPCLFAAPMNCSIGLRLSPLSVERRPVLDLCTQPAPPLLPFP